MTGRLMGVQSIAQHGRSLLTDHEIAYHLLLDLIPGIMGWDAGMRVTVDARMGRLELTVIARCAAEVKAHLLFEAVGVDPIDASLELDGCHECVAVRGRAWVGACRALAALLTDMSALGCSVRLS